MDTLQQLKEENIKLERELTRARYQLRISRLEADWLNELADELRSHGCALEESDRLLDKYKAYKEDAANKFWETYGVSL